MPPGVKRTSARKDRYVLRDRLALAANPRRDNLFNPSLTICEQLLRQKLPAGTLHHTGNSLRQSRTMFPCLDCRGIFLLANRDSLILFHE